MCFLTSAARVKYKNKRMFLLSLGEITYMYICNTVCPGFLENK